MGLIPELKRSPGEGNGYPLQYSSLGNYSPWGCKESDTTEQLSTHAYVYVWLLHFVVQQQLTQHCKATIP